MATIDVVTGITVERKLFHFPKGTFVGTPAVCTDDPTGCCPAESGSGSGGGGGGGGVDVPCCANSVPTTLYALITADCLGSVTVPFYYVGTDMSGNHYWEPSLTGALAGWTFFRLVCAVSDGFWRVSYIRTVDTGYGTWASGLPYTCDPFYLSPAPYWISDCGTVSVSFVE